MRLLSIAILLATSVPPGAHAQTAPARIPDRTPARFQLDPQDSTWQTGTVRVTKGGCLMLTVKSAVGVTPARVVGLVTQATRLQVLYNRADGWQDVNLAALRAHDSDCNLPRERG